MKRKFENITVIETSELYDEISTYANQLIDEATVNGSLSEIDADNEYIREIGRTGSLCSDYESTYMTFKCLKFKSPLLISLEKELEKRSLKQRQAAEMLEVKESTFSQIMTGKRNVSMQMAKKLYKVFEIDPKLILEYS